MRSSNIGGGDEVTVRRDDRGEFQRGQIFQNGDDRTKTIQDPFFVFHLGDTWSGERVHRSIVVSNFALFTVRTHQGQQGFLRLIGRVLGDFFQDLRVRLTGQIQVVRQSRSIAARTRKRILLLCIF